MKPSNDKVAIEPSLVAGRDYPRTYREFVEMFPDDNSCATYLEQLRWPNGFVCPVCQTTTTPWRQTRGRLVCPSCRHQSSVIAGTIMDKTRTPLTTWFEAGWHVTTAKNGLSAKTLEHTLGTSYRVSMVRAERKQLSGNVEVDETMVGGVEKGGKRGRGASKCIVVIAVEGLFSNWLGTGLELFSNWICHKIATNSYLSFPTANCRNRDYKAKIGRSLQGCQGLCSSLPSLATAYKQARYLHRRYNHVSNLFRYRSFGILQ